MNLVFYDPAGSMRHQYLSEMFFAPMGIFLRKTLGMAQITTDSLALTKHAVVICSADHLTPLTIDQLRNNNCKIVGFSCTDSSYVSQVCRSGQDLASIDLMFCLTGLQKVNHGREMIVDRGFNIRLEDRQFLPDEDWAVFDRMRKEGRLQSLPYVHWYSQPEAAPQPYASRSQKALIRGGNHMRRFLLALRLMNIDKLDVNSGFYTAPYFRDDMNPQFRYCDQCRTIWKRHGRYPMANDNTGWGCTNDLWDILLHNDPEPEGIPFPAQECSLHDLGRWNNKCPESFYAVAGHMKADMPSVEKLLNAQWLSADDHLKLLARITFTTDLKWLFSIYAAQRFWDAAMVGCLNILPRRTNDQQYFPEMNPGEHYVTFNEDLRGLDSEFEIDEKSYNEISTNAKAIYDQWMRPTEFAINTNLLAHIFGQIERHTT